MAISFVFLLIPSPTNNISPGTQQATRLHMSKECADRLPNTKPQRSFFQRFLHSSPFRSCWTINQHNIEESAASTSLLAQDGPIYQSSNATVQSTSLSNQVDFCTKINSLQFSADHQQYTSQKHAQIRVNRAELTSSSGECSTPTVKQ